MRACVMKVVNHVVSAVEPRLNCGHVLYCGLFCLDCGLFCLDCGLFCPHPRVWPLLPTPSHVVSFLAFFTSLVPLPTRHLTFFHPGGQEGSPGSGQCGNGRAARRGAQPVQTRRTDRWQCFHSPTRQNRADTVHHLGLFVHDTDQCKQAKMMHRAVQAGQYIREMVLQYAQLQCKQANACP